METPARLQQILLPKKSLQSCQRQYLYMDGITKPGGCIHFDLYMSVKVTLRVDRHNPSLTIRFTL